MMVAVNKPRRATLLCLTVAAVFVMLLAPLADAQMGYRDAPIAEENSVPDIAAPATLDNTAPEQFTPRWTGAPPVIPHRVEGHQVNLNANRCLTCHAKAGEGLSGVPAIGPSHFVDRDGQPTATLAARRYFCLQCHVPQHRSDLPVNHLFREER